VDAISIQEAKDIAEEEMDIGDADIEVGSVSAHEVKPEMKKGEQELS